jgi:hypothetical protein
MAQGNRSVMTDRSRSVVFLQDKSEEDIPILQGTTVIQEQL